MRESQRQIRRGTGDGPGGGEGDGVAISRYFPPYLSPKDTLGATAVPEDFVSCVSSERGERPPVCPVPSSNEGRHAIVAEPLPHRRIASDHGRKPLGLQGRL